MFSTAKLIYNPNAKRCPVFRKVFTVSEEEICERTELTVSALGVFQVFLNGAKVGDDVLSPGWEVYEKRIGAVRYTEPDGLLPCVGENILEIFVTPGWYSGRISQMAGFDQNNKECAKTNPLSVIAELKIGKRKIVTNKSWEVADSRIISSDIYDGTVVDARLKEEFGKVEVLEDFNKSLFCMVYEDGHGTPVVEAETVFPSEKIIITPKGEKVLDFGQNLVGYPVLSLNCKAGGRVRLSFAEVFDKDGNFYTDNYRSAKCQYDYTAKRGKQVFVPLGTFYGFRYVRIDEFPGEYVHSSIAAKIIHSDMPRTGTIRTGAPLINRLLDNVIRGQLGNYVDIPTDCPQRDERLGWTGDAQAFCRTAAYNFYVRDFFEKWLTDVVLNQSAQGTVPDFIPTPINRFPNRRPEPNHGWSDCITIIPYQLYLAYGDASLLSLTFDAMKKHVDRIGEVSKDKNLWTGCDWHYGDWLGLDSKPGDYHGASNKDITATAYYKNSVDIVCFAGDVLGKDVEKYKKLAADIRKTFIETYEDKLDTQTELVLAIAFDLTDHVKELGDKLVAKIHAAGDAIQTGFLGTGYILHALAKLGEYKLAYDLLLRTDFPSWLYPVTKGATTIWEHWDGIRPDGSFWSKNMNSYNHYAYGSVADWIWAEAAGIQPDPNLPGYQHVMIAPHPDKRLGTLDASLMTEDGEITSSWYYEDDTAHYRITTPVPATIVIDDSIYEVDPGEYVF